MKKSITIIFVVLFVVSACDFAKNTGAKFFQPQKEEVKNEEVIPVPAVDSVQPKTKAFGDIFFGMKKEEINAKNQPKQQLGKYSYSFSYRYNGDGEMYALLLNSATAKTLHFDTALKNYYMNMSRILTEKFGKPEYNVGFPSLFDVQNAGALVAKKWTDNKRQIELGIRQNKRDSYSVFCKILDVEMNQQEQERIYKLKNKDVIDAAKKF